MLVIRKPLVSIMTSLVVSLIIAFLRLNIAFADRSDVDSVVFVGEKQSAILSVCASANDVANTEILVYTASDGLLSFSNKKYAQLPVDEKRKFMEKALLSTKESGLGSQIKNKVYNFISEQDSTTTAAVKFLRSDASADFAVAAAWFKPFGSTFGVLLGLLSLFIFMFIGLSITIDIAYMVLPGVRVLLEGGVDDKAKWVSNEAYSAVRDCENAMKSNDYKGYMGIYFKRRLPSVLAMGIALGYLISGQIYSIITYLIDSFTWILQ